MGNGNLKTVSWSRHVIWEKENEVWQDRLRVLARESSPYLALTFQLEISWCELARAKMSMERNLLYIGLRK